jgi:dipeptidyl aminopeptidase/acylaminoacyl peptidase
VADVLAAIVKDPPDLSAVPPSLRRLIEKCLEKDPRKRLRDISSVELLLDESHTGAPVERAVRRPKTTKVAAIAGAIVLVFATIAITLLFQRRGAPEPAVNAIEFSIEPPTGTSFANLHSSVAVSPDGQHLVFSAGATGSPPTLWLRRLGSVEARALAGTEGATAPVWSPDGKSIAFAGQRTTGQPAEPAKNAIWLIDASGFVRPLESTPAQGRTPAWSPDGRRLAFQSNRGSPNGFHAVFVTNADGTGVTRVTGYDRDANHPEWSPDGKRLVFAARRAVDGEATGIAIADAP